MKKRPRQLKGAISPRMLLFIAGDAAGVTSTRSSARLGRDGWDHLEPLLARLSTSQVRDFP